MKSFVAGLVLALSLGLALAAPSQSATQNKEDQAFQECNATNPVQRNVRVVVGAAIVSGERIIISQEEKCFLLCFLQKVNFVDENGDIKNGPGLVNFTTHLVPELGKYVEHLIAHIWQIKRSVKGIEDKCQKAFVGYEKFSEAIFTIGVADGLNSSTNVKEKFIQAMKTGQPVDQEVAKQIKQFLEFFNAVITSVAKSAEKQAQPQ